MNTAKLIKQGEQNNSPLTIAHMANSIPCFYVEEAEIDGRNVLASFFNENDPASETQTVKIPVKNLVAFINETYGDYINTGYSEERVLDTRSPFDYLCDNITKITEEYINKVGGFDHE